MNTLYIMWWRNGWVVNPILSRRDRRGSRIEPLKIVNADCFWTQDWKNGLKHEELHNLAWLAVLLRSFLVSWFLFCYIHKFLSRLFMFWYCFIIIMYRNERSLEDTVMRCQAAEVWASLVTDLKREREGERSTSFPSLPFPSLPPSPP